MPTLRSTLRAGATALLVCLAGVVAAPSLGNGTGPAPVHSRGVRPLLVIRSVHPGTVTPEQACPGCYGPVQLENAYGAIPLYKEGINGAGTTIIIVDAFGAPTIKPDLSYFDASYGLPNPPHFTVVKFGTLAVPPRELTTWAIETSLDVEYAHAMAPGASLLLLETGANLPTLTAAETSAVEHRVGDVISQSWSEPETAIAQTTGLTVASLGNVYQLAAAKGITMLASSGDTGVTGRTSSGSYYFRKLVGWPASNPYVTAVGGTKLLVNKYGQRTAPDKVWNDATFFPTQPMASGGGVSAVFPRPSYQNAFAGVVGGRRGVPDISMSADFVYGPVMVYVSGIPAVSARWGLGDEGWVNVGGTSEASPLFAGVVAMADQMAHHMLGFVNPALYAIAEHHEPGIVPVTTGNNTVSFQSAGGASDTIPGYSAGPGYNLATGLGTVNVAALVPELVAATK
jgi:subtilase family serine protease